MFSLKNRFVLSPLIALVLVFFDWLVFGVTSTENITTKLVVYFIVYAVVIKVFHEKIPNSPAVFAATRPVDVNDDSTDQEDSDKLASTWIFITSICFLIVIATISGSLPLTFWHSIVVFMIFNSMIDYLNLFGENFGITVHNVIFRRTYIFVTLASVVALIYVVINGEMVWFF